MKYGMPVADRSGVSPEGAFAGTRSCFSPCALAFVAGTHTVCSCPLDAAAVPAGPDERGWLLKRGKLNKAFKRRYFELDLDNMMYYEEIGGAQKGVIELRRGSTVTITETDGQHELHVTTRDRVYKLRSPDNLLSQLRIWERAIQRAIGGAHE